MTNPDSTVRVETQWGCFTVVSDKDATLARMAIDKAFESGCWSVTNRINALLECPTTRRIGKPS